MSSRGQYGAWHLDKRGSTSMIFAIAMPMLIMAVGAGIDFSRMADARAALQRAVDNAALSGAAAYVLYTPADSFKAVAYSTANAAFCQAAATLPAGATLMASTGAGSAQCNTGPGPAVSGPTITAVIGGYVPGQRGAANTSCNATNTVVTGVACGFLVTVTAKLTVKPAFSGYFSTQTIMATATAANPFLDLGKVLTINLGDGQAWNANSLWVYPLLLDANGNVDFSSDPGARPPTTTCTGAPDQTRCGSYTMLASTFYTGHYSCYTGNQGSACTTADGATFGGAQPGGVVQSPQASGAVLTATTPLGFALESTSGGNRSLGLDVNGGYGSPPGGSASGYGPYITKTTKSGCQWPAVTTYNTVTQSYPPATAPRGTNLGLAPNAALEGTSKKGPVDWTLTTHWFYSSLLINNQPPSYDLVNAQSKGFQQQVQSVSTANPPTICNDTTNLTTEFPPENCSLYIVRDPSPSTPLPDPIYTGGWGVNDHKCWPPSSTPGRLYAALSCQGFAGHTFVFLWNDMGGSYARKDDTNYGDATTTVSCSGVSKVQLIG